ncbi:MAG: nucleotidyltransferase family protein [Candidatus Altiarchaeota archaeon]|nr:nucleotidyltransferase family protein [Candidatus Altiarchaeota archaeon]
MGKERISLTLDENILKRVDRQIGELANNRSNVIELLLQKGLINQMPKSAVILVGGGKENKLMELFEDQTLIEYHIEALSKVGVKDIFVLGSDTDKMKTHLSGKGIHARFIKDENEGSAGALKKLSGIVNNTFFVIYGDVITSADLVDMYQFHMKEASLMTIGLTTSDKISKFGVLEVKGTKVVSFSEKPKRSKSFLVSVGVFVIEPEIFEIIPENKKISIEEAVIPSLIQTSQLSGYAFGGFWKDYGEE